MSNIETVYLIHHSHTDIGYTHDQPIVWDLHGRFIEEAVRLAGKYQASNTEGAFRWTVENTAVLYAWLKQADSELVKRFVELEHAGRIEVTGMFANMTPLLDTDQLVESLQLVGKLRREYGFTITHAMNCDVNGEPWPLVDVLLDAGIEGFTMAINTHFGGAPLARPNVFQWEGPSGRKILAYNGWPYDTGWRFGMGHKDEKALTDWWPRIQQRMDAIDYPLPILMMQSYHPFGDNGPAYEDFTAFIDAWNQKGNCPHLVFATPTMWWDAVKQHLSKLPSYCGDWTDFWNFGSISSAREQATNRNSRMRLRSADAVAAATLGVTHPLRTAHTARTFQQYREEAWKSLHLWDEHTWGADLSLRAPESEDTITQWYHKAHYAYLARSLSLMLQRDALADLSRYVQRENADDLLVFNPLPWARTILGEIANHVVNPRGLPEDATSGRHSQDRVWSTDLYSEAAMTREGGALESRLGLPPVEVSGYGFTLVKRANLVELKPEAFNENALVENPRFRLTFDLEKGGVVSLYDKLLKREWVDPAPGYPLNGFVHETVSDKAHPWPRWLMFRMEWNSDQVERDRGWKPEWRATRTQPSRLLVHRVYQTPYGTRVIQVLEASGIASQLVQSVFLPKDDTGYVEFESWWVMGQTTHPEATYLLFPFNVPNPQVRIDLGGQAMVAGQDQLPGVCFDYYTAQQWVDLSNEELGVTVALPDNPMVQFGDFHFGHNQQNFSLDRALFLGWVTNTYWETNFRTHQPGGVHARYRVYPHGKFDQIEAYRRGMETALAQPLVQHMGEPVEAAVYPSTGQLLQLPEQLNPNSGVFTLHVKPAAATGGTVVRLYNASDQTRTAQVGSGLLRIQAARRCDLMENPSGDLPVTNGTVQIDLPARQVSCLLLTTSVQEQKP